MPNPRTNPVYTADEALGTAFDPTTGTVRVSQPNPSVSAALVDRSGTIAVQDVAQQVAAANPARRYFIMQNVSDTDMWVNFGVDAVATQPSFHLLPGASLVMEAGFVSSQSVSVICAAAGKAFTAKEA